ncbi:MAG: hypothetical protein AAFX78_20015 [Cyanobacteria bacterium J06638_20]
MHIPPHINTAFCFQQNGTNRRRRASPTSGFVLALSWLHGFAKAKPSQIVVGGFATSGFVMRHWLIVRTHCVETQFVLF